MSRGRIERSRLSAAESYVASGMQQVEGWLHPLDASLILDLGRFQDELAVPGGVGEIGVHHGKLFILLSLLRRPGERAIAVDVFENQHLNLDRSGRGDRARFSAHLERFGAGAEVEILAADSRTLSASDLRAADGSGLRLLSIDGGHTADLTYNDLKLAAASVETGGVVILDDYFNPSWPGVSEGFAKFAAAGAGGLTPWLIGHNKTMLATQEWSERYLALFEPAVGRRGEVREQEFYGGRVLCISPRKVARHPWRRRAKRQLLKARRLAARLTGRR